MPEYAEYTVQWMIELGAGSPREAAEEALKIMRDPTSLATTFTVIDEAGGLIEVDLLNDDAEEEAENEQD